MTTIHVPRPGAVALRVRRARAAWSWRERILGAVALSMAVLVGGDGSPGWRVVRVAAVLGVVVLTDAGLRRRSPAGAALAVVAGTVTAATGAGIAGPHLAKTGLSIPAAAGVVAVLAGVALVVLGARVVLARLRGWWKLLAVPSLVVALVAAGVVGIAVAATNVPRVPLGTATLADRGIPYTDVALRTADGVDLSAWYAPSTNGAGVALLHGAGSTRSSVLDHAVVLARHGYGVLLVDARGHGLSDGRAMDFGWYGDLDVRAAVDFLAARPDVDAARIAVLGLSMGGEEALGALAGDGRIAAVVAEGATGRTAADHAWLSDVYGVRGWVQERIDAVLFGITDLLTAAGPPTQLRDAVAAAGRPVLLVAAGDVADESRAADFIRSGAPDTVTVWEAPGAGHTDALATEPAEWERRVTAFFATTLELEEEP